MGKKWLMFVVLLIVGTASDTVDFYYAPLFMERAEFEASIQLSTTPKTITNRKVVLYKN